MIIEIYGRMSCRYCVRAIDLAEQLCEENDEIEYSFINMEREGISKEDLAKLKNIEVKTVPQIFIDQQHIGGCSDFEALIDEQNWI